MFSNLTAAQWTKRVQQVYEIAFGISLGVYDVKLVTFKPSCSVASSGPRNMRGGVLLIVFSATVTEELVSNATSAARRNDANTVMSMSVAEANTILKAAAPEPQDHQILVSPPQMSHTGAASDQGQSSSGLDHVVVIIVAWVSLFAAVAIAFCCWRYISTMTLNSLSL